jgi:hypothetical protein
VADTRPPHSVTLSFGQRRPDGKGGDWQHTGWADHVSPGSSDALGYRIHHGRPKQRKKGWDDINVGMFVNLSAFRLM